MPRWPLLLLGLVAAVSLLHPPVPLFWDEFAWLGKAELALEGWGELRARALDPAFSTFAEGHPLFLPLAAGALASVAGEPGALVYGARAIVLLFFWLFLGVLAERHPSGERGGAIPAWVVPLALLACPFFWVHVRAVYADLPVGLASAAVVAALGRVVDGEPVSRRAAVGCVVAALLLPGLKDEGFVHVVAACVPAAILLCWRCRRRALGLVLVVLAAGALPFIAWHALLSLHGVHNPERAVTAAGFSRIGPLLTRGILRFAIDLETWGAFWGLALGGATAAAVAARRVRDSTRLALSAVALQLVMTFGFVLVASERVFEYVTVAGHVSNRLLLQVAPSAAVVIGLVVRDLGVHGREE